MKQVVHTQTLYLSDEAEINALKIKASQSRYPTWIEVKPLGWTNEVIITTASATLIK